MGFLAISEIIPPGCVLPFAGTTPPSGWLMCDGSAVSRTTYRALYAAIGNAHGSGDGSTTFHLPDYRGRFLRGTDNMGTVSGAAGRDPNAADRTAMNTGGNPANGVGSVQGHQYESHGHSLNGLAGNSGGNSSGLAHPRDSGGQSFGIHYSTYANGGSETRPINAYVNYIIKV